MTIIVKRRCNKSDPNQKFKIMSGKGSMGEFLKAKEKQDARRKAAAIRRYAKKNRLEPFFFHRDPWIFNAYNGEKVAMAAGYYAWVHGVLHQIVAE